MTARRVPDRSGGATGQDAAEAEYRRLLDRSLVPIGIHDGQVVLYANPVAVRALGATSHTEIVGHSLHEFVHPASMPALRERLAGLRQDGDTTELTEVSLLRIDGSVRLAYSVSVLRKDRGKTCYEVIFRDPPPLVPAADGLAGPAHDTGAGAVIDTTLDGIVTRWGSDAVGLYGHSPHDVVGMPIERAVGGPLRPDELARIGHRENMIHHDSAGNPLSVLALAIRTTDGYVVICDAAASGPHHDEHRLYALLDLLHEGVVIMGCDGRFEYTNVAARRILGGGAHDLAGTHHRVSGIDLPLYEAHGRLISAEAHPIAWILKTGLSVGGQVIGVDRGDGRRVWLIGHGRRINPADPRSAVLLSFTDITEHHDARERLWHDATHDWLTGLPNRSHALDRAAAGLTQGGPERLAAVLFIDLDRLKAVNDNHGHPIGDDVLRIAAGRMRSVTRPQDVIARIGGDEFVVLAVGSLDRSDLTAIAQRIHAVLDEDIVVGSLVLRIGASIGITTVSGDDARGLAEVLRDADAAMYQAKAQGPSGTVFFESDSAG